MLIDRLPLYWIFKEDCRLCFCLQQTSISSPHKLRHNLSQSLVEPAACDFPDAVCNGCMSEFLSREPGERFLKVGNGESPAVGSLRVVSAGIYESGLAELVKKFKYQSDRLIARDLSRLLINTVVKSKLFTFGEQPVLVPIPLHKMRRRERGFNQSQILAQQVAEYLGLVSRSDILVRQRDTAKQHGLSKVERLANVRGAFVCQSKKMSNNLGGHYILVDDVLTSGATITACAEALFKEGAHSVSALTVAHAQMRH